MTIRYSYSFAMIKPSLSLYTKLKAALNVNFIQLLIQLFSICYFEQDLTFFKVKLNSNVDRERLVRIEHKQYENMDRAESQLIKSVERVERKEIK